MFCALRGRESTDGRQRNSRQRAGLPRCAGEGCRTAAAEGKRRAGGDRRTKEKADQIREHLIWPASPHVLPAAFAARRRLAWHRLIPRRPTDEQYTGQSGPLSSLPPGVSFLLVVTVRALPAEHFPGHPAAAQTPFTAASLHFGSILTRIRPCFSP